MTNKEVVELMQGNSVLNEARKILSSEIGRMEQAGQQSTLQSIFDVRRMEFDAVRKIAKVLGVEL